MQELVEGITAQVGPFLPRLAGALLMITGEAVPEHVGPGSLVEAGTVNISGPLTIAPQSGPWNSR